MSKSSNGSNDTGLSMQYLGDLIQKVLDSNVKNIDPISQEFQTKLLENFNAIVGVLKDDKQVTTQELKKIVTYVKSTLSTDYGVKFTESFNKSLKQFESTLESKIKNENGKVDANKLVSSLSNIISSAIAQSLKAEQRGSAKDALLKGVSKDSEAMKALADEIAKKIGMSQATDSLSAKLINFFKEDDKKKEKRGRGFVKDLIEGIASSKFVGGALGDLIKLGGLQLNTWLSQFGPIGKALGRVAVVLTQILGTLLSGALIQNILGVLLGRKLFGALGGALGGAFKGGFNLLKGLFKGGKAGKTLGFGASLAGIFGPKTMTTQMARSTLKAGTVFRDSATGKLRKVVEGAVKADGTKSLRTVAVKEASSTGAKTIGKVAGKGVGKAVGAGALKTLGKKIPGIGLLLGAGLAVDRARKGDWLGAGGELLSGAASTVPGWGTAVSLAIDGALMAKDAGVFGKGTSKVGAKAGTSAGKMSLKTGLVAGALGTLGGGALLVTLINLLKGHFDKQDKNQEESKNFWQDFVNALMNSKIGQWLGFGQGGLGNSSSIPTGAEKKGFGSSWTDAKGAKDIGGLKVAKDGSILNLHKMTQDQASDALQAYEKSNPTAFNRLYEWADAGHANLSSFQTDAVKKVNGKKTGALMYKGASSDLDKLRAELIKAGMSSSKANALSFTSGKLTGSNRSHGVGGWKSHNNQYGLAFDLGGGGAWTQADYDKYGGLVSDFYKNRASQKFNISYEKSGQGKSTGKHWDAKPISNYRPAGAVENEKDAEKSQQITAQKHSIDAIKLVSRLEGKEEADKLEKIHQGNQEEFNKALDDKLKEYGITHMKDSKGKERWYHEDAKIHKSVEFDPTGNLDFAKKTMTYMTNNEQ